MLLLPVAMRNYNVLVNTDIILVVSSSYSTIKLSCTLFVYKMSLSSNHVDHSKMTHGNYLTHESNSRHNLPHAVVLSLAQWSAKEWQNLVYGY